MVFYSLRSDIPSKMNNNPIPIKNQTSPPFKNSNAAVPNPAKFATHAYIGATTRIKPTKISSHLFMFFQRGKVYKDFCSGVYMAFKEKVIGFFIIVLGVWPFLLKVDSVGAFFASYKLLEVLTPGEIVYQIALIVLGALLIWKIKPHRVLEKAE